MFRKILGYATLPLFLLLLWIMPPRAGRAQSPPQGFNQGPDIITGEVGPYDGLAEFGSSGTEVGLAMWTTICNAGNVPVDVFAMPATNHAIIPQNLYRMSRGAGNNDRFEQIGHSWVKHMFASSTMNDCGFGCTSAGTETLLGVGCSDVYASDQNAAQHDLTSRAWINPFTGVFSSASRNHAGHVHTGTSHRLLVESTDLNTTMNPGATYYAEVQYLSPHEFNWCQSHPGQCNMYNNVSYRQFNVSGTTSFTFTPAAPSVLMSPAVTAWTGATINPIEPEPGVDGRAFIAYKVTGPDAGVWHYEYALYNMNLDRAIQSFSVPLGCAITVSNLGFHAPPNHPGFSNDGTLGDAGFSNAPWTSSQTTDALSWSSETFAQNQNANAIRWGTLYNVRFDSNKPPIGTNATIGFFKTGAPITVPILGPNACDQAPTPSPGTPTPTATPPPSSPTPTPSATPPEPPAQALQLSTRMFVQTGDNVGIGGFIITGPVPKQVMVRAVGASIVFGAMADPVLELHGPPGFVTIINDNCGDVPFPPPPPFCQPGSLDAAIVATLDPGAYTAIVRGKNDTSGVALVEVFDLNPSVDSKLANISTRAFVNTADNIVIAGFILGGNSGNDRIVVRGIGPSLTAFGVPNALANPTLELRDDNGVLLVSNNDWQDDPVQAAELIAAGLAPTNSLESGIAALLPPGLYTALLVGLNNGTGVGLIEVYDLGAPGGTPGPSPTPPNPTPTLPPPPASPTPSPPGSTPSPTPPTATPTPSPAGACTENFDGTPRVFLPGGAWVISTVNPFSPPNCLFAPNPSSISDESVDSVNISIHSASAALSFRNNFDTEHDPPPAEVFWDGYVLEASINGGAYDDVTSPAVGGTFVSGGYTGEINASGNNPLAGRMAWSGNSAGYIHTVINLPASLNGQTISLRFRMGTDEAGGAPGVRIDDFSLTGGSCP